MTEISHAEEERSTTNTAEERKRFIIDGREPHEILFPETFEQVSEALRLANEQQCAIAPIGLGAFLHLGMPPRQYHTALSLQRLDKVLDYQPTDMTTTVEAGLSLADLQQVLGEHGQWLPIDPPSVERVTIGGLLAANLSGPVRFSQGTIRDFLIGLKVVRADGTLIKGGGRVVKNVAGYDVPKLFCGSFGTLGVIVEATFKLRPKPASQAVLGLSFPSAQEAMNLSLQVLGSELQPFFMELANFSLLQTGESALPYQLFIGLAGVPEEVRYQSARVQEMMGTGGSVVRERQEGEAQPLVQALREFPVTGSAALRCKASILPDKIAAFCRETEAEAATRGFSFQLLAHAGNGVVLSRFSNVEESPPEKLLSFIDWLRILTKRLDGYLVIESIDPALKERADVWGHVGGALPLMKRLKETLDPNGILNPGRFVGGI